MTPEEVFAQLRDIHTPERIAVEAAGYDYRPLLFFVALTAAALLARALWRRAQAGRLLARIPGDAPEVEQRDALVRLLAERGAHRDAGPAPEAAFAPPKALTAEGVGRLRRWVGRRIR